MIESEAHSWLSKDQYVSGSNINEVLEIFDTYQPELF